MIIAEIRNMKTEATFKEHEWIEARKMLEDAQPNLSRKQADQDMSVDREQEKKELQSGDEVKVVSLNQKGTILEKISDRKSTRLNSSHVAISYAVFCLK